MRKIAWIVILLGVLPACTWVKHTDAGQNVRVVSSEQLGQCKKLGKTTVSVFDKVGFISRSYYIVEEELFTLARNSAAEMGGDTVVVAGPISGDEQPFDVYQCGR